MITIRYKGLSSNHHRKTKKKSWLTSKGTLQVIPRKSSWDTSWANFVKPVVKIQKGSSKRYLQKLKTIEPVKFLKKSFNKFLENLWRVFCSNPWKNSCRYVYRSFLFNFWIPKLLLEEVCAGNPAETIKASWINSLENHWRHTK